MPRKKTAAALGMGLLLLAGAALFFMSPLSDPFLHPQPTGIFDGHPLPEGIVCDRILVEKKRRFLTLYRSGQALKSYHIALGGNPVGHKEFEGDQKTPEGIYQISGRNPLSLFHLSLRVSYPNETDRLHAEAQNQSPGGDIMIHGFPNQSENFAAVHKSNDWTAGCIAVTDEEIRELWKAIPDGVTIEIRP